MSIAPTTRAMLYVTSKCRVIVTREQTAIYDVRQAETLIREQLAVKETPSLWVTLGDVTHDRAHYERAWEQSGGRNALSQRALAYWHLERAQVRHLPHWP